MENRSAALGLNGLPVRMNRMAQGMIYAVVADQQTIRIPLLARTAIQSIAKGVPCMLLSSAEPSAWVRKARLAGVDLASQVKRGALKIFRLHPDSAKEVFRAGAEQVTKELEQTGLERGSLILIDQADSFFQLADPRIASQACEHFQAWVEAHSLTMLAAFSPAGRSPRDYVTLRSISENLAGYAVMRNGPEDAQIEFRHWFSPQGPNPRISFTLRFEETGELSAVAVGSGSSAAIDAVMESEYGTAKAISDFQTTAQGWKSIESYIDAVSIVRTQPAGTIILHFASSSEFRQLCQTVASIRSAGKPQWRVVVRERGSRLRISHVVALMRLGVSMVIPETMDSSAARLLCEALRGTLFTRGVETNVDAVLDGLNGLNSKRLKNAGEFKLMAERLMAAGSEFDLPHTLVRLGLSRIEGERISSLLERRGARDMLVTEQDYSLWVFLFGCPSEHAANVLARLLGRNFERLFEGWVRINKPQDILAALEQLKPSTACASKSVVEPTVPVATSPRTLASELNKASNVVTLKKRRTA